MANPTLVIFRGPTAYMVRLVNQPDIVRILGTDIVPTPFTAAAYPDKVLRTITKLNPDCDVQIEVSSLLPWRAA